MLTASRTVPRRSRRNEFTAWPRIMRAQTAAAYVDERSVAAFLRGVGKIWPKAITVAGKGKRWLREDLDTAIERLSKRTPLIQDAADLL